MNQINETIFLKLLQVLRRNIHLNRRQLCQLGAFFGVNFLSLFFLKIRSSFGKDAKPVHPGEKTMELMRPNLSGKMSLEETIKLRRTVRSFKNAPITAQQFSQILWAAQGITEEGGYKRAAPSGGALYPCDIYAVIGENGVEDFKAGVFHYGPKDHSVRKVSEGDKRKQMSRASLGQMWMATAPVSILITAEYERICMKYGERGVRYALIEVGHIGQNIFLQCQALGLEAGIVGAFNDQKVSEAVGTAKRHEPLIIMPLGRRG